MLLTRLLIEFLRISGRPLVGYDLDPREPALAGCFPSLIWPVDIADTRGQMALFDRILSDHWRTTVIGPAFPSAHTCRNSKADRA